MCNVCRGRGCAMSARGEDVQLEAANCSLQAATWVAPCAKFLVCGTTCLTFLILPVHSSQVTNMLFRMGAAAVLLSNKPKQWQGRAKYSLTANHRVHLGMSDDAYTCV